MSQIEQPVTSSGRANAVSAATGRHREASHADAGQPNGIDSRHWTLTGIAAIILASFAFLIPAFLNGFPFLYPDSGDYLVLTPQLYRSPFYSLFLLFAHMNRFIWNTVMVQALLLSWLLFIICRLYSSRPLATFSILVALLVPFSSAAYFASFIMADLMTPLMFLAIYILAFHWSELSRFDRIFVFLFTCLAACSHIAHVAMGIGLLALVAVLLVLTGNSWRMVARRVGLLSVPIVLATSALWLNNAITHRAFTLYPAGNSLLMANLIEAGPARRYIHDVCPAAGFKICSIVDKLPRTANQLLWGGSYRALGGLRAMEDEARTIVSATLRAYPQDVLAMVIRNFVAALNTHRPAYEFVPWTGEVPSLTALIEKKFGSEARDAYLASAQSKGRVPRDLIGAVDDVTFPISFVAFVWFSFLALRRQMAEPACLSILVVCGFIGNALLTSAASGVFDRYQARLSWLFLAAGVLVCARLRDAAIPASRPFIQTALAALRLQPAFGRARIASIGSFGERAIPDQVVPNDPAGRNKLRPRKP
ncbi:MAG: hypothetical protein JO211_02015 [Acidobacteriaceae bacterium]|nr:hypothetical protein [Acidobacteriaceae bacterium]